MYMHYKLSIGVRQNTLAGYLTSGRSQECPDEANSGKKLVVSDHIQLPKELIESREWNCSSIKECPNICYSHYEPEAWMPI
jgi:hypothetical protein